MQLTIDGLPVAAQPGQTLLDLVRQLGLDAPELSRRPLAAKLAGGTFPLNYIPVRQGDAGLERPTMRRAMEASGGVVQLLRYKDVRGKQAYLRTAQFVLFLALRQLYPGVRAKMNCTLGSALYVEVDTPAFSAAALKKRVAELVAENIPLLRRRISTGEAIDHFRLDGQQDKARLLSWRKHPWFDEYVYGDFADYYYGEMAPFTGYLSVWDILPAPGGFLFIFPREDAPDRVAHYEEMPKFFNVFAEGERWCSLMDCETVADLNELVDNGKIRELIRVNEALHERSFSQIADQVCQRKAKAVLLAGPSSSGKTTSANRLAVQLRVHGKRPILMSLDDYYLDRDQIPRNPDGSQDLEHINTIDTALFRQQLQELLDGQTVELPVFDFQRGKRAEHGKILKLEGDSVIIVEGLHALNPCLLPQGVAENLIFKLYVSPLLPLNLDDHNRISVGYLRLLRRIVRDHATRGSSVEQTLSMWDSVLRGEKRWIYPFQEQADVLFNSSTLYELAVLKGKIFPLLTQVQPDAACFDEVNAIVKVLKLVQEAQVEDEIPPTSIVREFIGGNSFYR